MWIFISPRKSSRGSCNYGLKRSRSLWIAITITNFFFCQPSYPIRTSIVWNVFVIHFLIKYFCTGYTDETPRDYHCNLGPDGKRRDADERPELCRGTVDFVATKEYMVSMSNFSDYFALKFRATFILIWWLDLFVDAKKATWFIATRWR